MFLEWINRLLHPESYITSDLWVEAQRVKRRREEERFNLWLAEAHKRLNELEKAINERNLDNRRNS